VFLSAALTGAAPAFADAFTPRSVTVRSDDLDLSNRRDAARMLRRLERAADAVCGRTVAEHYSGQRDEYRSCRAATLEAALNQLGAPTVAALHRAQDGGGEVELADRRN
jgi:UrcA family protein